ncbi:MAG: GNAT family N-acetyltransferase [Candidatus Limnocylindrales bacterium]
MSGAAIRVDVVRPGDPAWEGWLEHIPSDVFHSGGYHTYSEESGEGQAYLLVVGDADRGLAWPYLLRDLEGQFGTDGRGLADVVSVYGYPGPLAWGCTPGEPFLGHAWREIQAVWRSQGAITAFTRFHPLLGNASLASGMLIEGAEAAAPDPIVANGRTVSVDLTLGYDGARAAYGRDLRREVDRAHRQGLETSVDTDWTELATFARLYNETMLRLRASDFYLFQEADFWRLRAALGDHLHLLVTRLDGVVVAAGLFTSWERIIEWFLVGTDSAYSALSPSKPLVDFAIGWAIEQGGEVLHLGGGRGGAQDSLLWFKGRFSPRRHTFHTGRWLLDPAAASKLTAAQRARLEPGTQLDPHYFPLYRAPIIEAPDDQDGEPSPEPDRQRADPGAPSEDGRAIQIRRVTPDDVEALGDLLENIDGTYFQPHPMTREEAARIGALRGRDIFLIGRVGHRGVAYGMLRGWDEGYTIASLGIGIRRDAEHRGYARAMMTALHDIARQSGATRVRLRVHPNNTRAARLYHLYGYREAGFDRHETLMILDLAGDAQPSAEGPPAVGPLSFLALDPGPAG